MGWWNVLELDRCWLHNPECSDSTTLHTRKRGLFCVSYTSVELLLNTDEVRAVKVALECWVGWGPALRPALVALSVMKPGNGGLGWEGQLLSQAGLVALGLLPHFRFQPVVFAALFTKVGVKVWPRVTDIHAHTFTCIFWPHCTACSILVPWPGIEPLPWQWKCWVLNIWLPGNSPFHAIF